MNDYYECGEGWLPLIEDAKTIVSKYNLEHPDLEIPLDFVQIKEKWGGLRLYLNQYIPEIANDIKRLEEISYVICENCGESKNVSKEWTDGYLYTLCDKCRNELIKKKL